MKQKTIYSVFKDVVARQPDSIAIIEEDRTLSFSQLDELTDAIAAKFYDKQPKAVGIVMYHGAEQIAAMLAVLKSGAYYVPAEPSLPKERIDYMMKSADVELIITDNLCKHLSPTDKVLNDRSEPSSLAYVLYTSGTSGRPKGVSVENHSVVNYAEAFEAEFHVCKGDVMLQLSVCSFDIFVEEVYTTLLNGAALCIPSQSVHNGALKGLLDFAERHGVTIIDGFPYLIAEINKLGYVPESVRLIISGGDVIRASYI
ncbi:MAG: AMP-binding protein, partial [Duncaniella sp.]|nr:AMP-binding protein [Duncaniella sp.]